MSRLVQHSTRVTDMDVSLLEVPYYEYLKLRIQFWKWRLHRTMGRPVLLLRRDPTTNPNSEKEENV